MTEDEPEKIAPARTEISYTIDAGGASHVMAVGPDCALPRPRDWRFFTLIQSKVITQGGKSN